MSEWISVDDRIPDVLDDDVHSETVLVYLGRGLNRITIGQYYQFGELEPYWRTGDADYEPVYSSDRYPVTHWMPLPEPPLEKGDVH